jgi:deoxyadenosine/deoxycytidine kinase
LGELISNSEVALESFQGNEYLEPFYEEMKKVGANAYNKYAYPVQMVFLKSRLERESACNSDDKTYIIDRSIFEDKYIFAENQKRTNQISDEEYEEYMTFFNENYQTVKPLDVAIYIRAGTDTLVERIQKRGRDMENSIDTSYLTDLGVLYEESLLPALEEMSKGKLIVLVYDVENIDPDTLAKKCHEDIMAAVSGQNC